MVTRRRFLWTSGLSLTGFREAPLVGQQPVKVNPALQAAAQRARLEMRIDPATQTAAELLAWQRQFRSVLTRLLGDYRPPVRWTTQVDHEVLLQDPCAVTFVRMQLEALEVSIQTEETRHIQQIYGLDNPATRSYGRSCLLARKLVERGVRFVQVMVPPDLTWDTHPNFDRAEKISAATDLPATGLIRDLKQRGLLESTVVG